MAGNKGIVPSNFFTFNAANQTITFSNDYAGLDLAEITYITNIKNGVATVIYDPFDATKGGTLNGLTLTLAYNTTAMADTDPLQVIVGFTPLNADPIPVRIVEGPDQKDDTELLNRIADGVDFLNLSLDQAEGIQVNTREINPAKRDENNAQMVSDAIEALRINIPPGATVYTTTIDTQGYSILTFNTQAGSSWAINAINYNSNRDFTPSVGLQQSLFFLMNSSGITPYVNGITSSGYGQCISPCMGRFVRISITNNASAPLPITILLRNGTPPWPSATTIQGLTTFGLGVTSTSVGQQALNTAFPIAGMTGATTNPPNAASTLATAVPNPTSIGGVERPYIGALGGIFRHITVDGGGRYILGGDTPDTETRFQSRRGDGSIPGIPPRGVGARSNNMVGAQSLTVDVTNQDFGDTQVMLLRQILTELKILNQQFVEMPQLLNQANFTMSDPQEYRNDGDFDSSIQ